MYGIDFKKQTMCYITADMVLKKLSAERKICHKNTHSSIILKSSLNHLYNLIQSITTIELNINCKKCSAKAKNYRIRNTFWIPRIFNHAFNIRITDKNVVISQSWFKAMEYKTIYTLTKHQFIKWLDKFREAVRNYRYDPQTLFTLFKYKPTVDDKKLIRFIKNEVEDMDICVDVKHSVKRGSCDE